MFLAWPLCLFDGVLNRDHAMLIDLWLVVCRGCNRRHRAPWLVCKIHEIPFQFVIFVATALFTPSILQNNLI